jgi:anti-sigma B factor antagonist
MRDFELRSRRRDASLEVALAGDLDMATVFKLEPELDLLLVAPGVQALVLDLADVGFVDSAGLGVLLSIRERANQLGIEMEVARPSAPVRRLLGLTCGSASCSPDSDATHDHEGDIDEEH